MRISHRALLANELGQMSIFLALVFQVLFVFFAMVINIGLIVHDKINLQNSVDLGAYYAAQKQSEILNEIAHLNYQIRQEYKLLAWRYWVLGTLGRDGGPPLKPDMIPPQISPMATALADAPRLVRKVTGNPLDRKEELPVACVANPHWWEFGIISAPQPPNEQYCWRDYDSRTTPIPITPAPPTPATIGINSAAYNSSIASAGQYRQSCRNAAALSWVYVASIVADYKFANAYRKRAIRALTANLVSETPLDREGVPIREGVIKTIEKNLTESNRQGFDPTNVAVLNGLAKEPCSGGSYPGENTVKEILTAPGLYFALLYESGGGCVFERRIQQEYSAIETKAFINLDRWDPDRSLRSMVGGEPANPNDDYHSTLGFEKNPWCMAYMGVKTEASSRKPFAPFGKPTQLVARSFAQPFGGRIGPWYSKWWDRGSYQSRNIGMPVANTAARLVLNGDIDLQNQSRTDPLTSPRLSPGSGSSYMFSSLTIPNVSRFPGDRLGFRSQRALGENRNYFRDYYNREAAAMMSPTEPRPRINWFMGYSAGKGDSLAYDYIAVSSGGAIPGPVTRMRQVEKAAVSPDLFDISYYSIDPSANLTYLKTAKDNPARYGRSTGVASGDLGYHDGVPDLEKASVEAQIQATSDGTTPGLDPSLYDSLYWFVRAWQHLLTGWAPNQVTEFSFPKQFGTCEPGSEAVDDAMIPGKCASGGRVGYSVRSISRAHLLGEWTLGGEGVGKGPILNPPPDDMDF